MLNLGTPGVVGAILTFNLSVTSIGLQRYDTSFCDTLQVFFTTIGQGINKTLNTEELRLAYSHRSPVETNFFVAQDTAAMEMPRAWTENAIKRRIGLALLSGFLLKAIAAVCEPIATGPWDRQPQPTAGRLSHHLNVRVNDFSALSLKEVKSRNYRKIQKPQEIRDFTLSEAA